MHVAGDTVRWQSFDVRQRYDVLSDAYPALLGALSLSVHYVFYDQLSGLC